MEIGEVKEGIRKIKSEADDDETAHRLEDDLWYDVLVAISEGADNPKELAKECLKTCKIEFERWYA